MLAFPRAKLPKLPADMSAIYSRLFRAAFPATSHHAMCKAAARVLGCHADTIGNIVTGGVSKVDYPTIALATVIYEHRTGKPFELVPGIFARLAK